ncbi:flagellar protein FlaG [Collimonas sp. NPDC087041]|uniref:flagellar protein FlaG n=1 Tax=Collimonas sp. NPDC087041 TaxID=3363960 RepID=UPI0038242085
MANSIDAISPSKLLPTEAVAAPASNKAGAAIVDGDAAASHEQVSALERAEIEQKVEDINRQLQIKAISVQFQIEPGYKDVVLKVVDQQDGKVILQIPSVEVVRFAKVMDQLKGVLLEKTA